MRTLAILLAALAICLLTADAGSCGASGDAYDPLKQLHPSTDDPIDLTIEDEKRIRKIPIRVFLPADEVPAPVVLFSHGLGGSRRACGYAAEHWRSRGYVVVVMQHHGSDETVWKDKPVWQRMDALKSAASPSSTKARYADVVTVIDQLERWNSDQEHRFHQRFDLDLIGMSGHSYGASTTQGIGGQWAPVIGQRFTDKRVDAALMFSPNRSRRVDPQRSFSKVTIPWMLMTGTKDTSPINDTTVEDRRTVYPALPSTIDKYELVLHDAEHSAFADGGGRRRQATRNPNHHRVILALSTAFWDSHLRGDDEAAAWLRGEGVKSVLESQDLWQQHHPE